MKSLRKARDALRSTESTQNTTELPGLTDNAAFNPEAQPNRAKDGRSTTRKVQEKARAIKDVAAHPRQRAKKRATAQIAVNERPWFEDQGAADEELFVANDRLEEAIAEESEATDTSAVNEARARVKGLENHREEMQVAYHMSRYVSRARVVRRPLIYPHKENYRQYNENGKYAGLNWVKWMGHLVLYGLQDASLHYVDPSNAMPYSREVLTGRVERLLVASEAFQLWWMRVRKIYTWEDPWLTFKWLVLYLVLLKTGYFMSFFWGYLLYSVLSNYSGKHSRDWARHSHDRSKKTKERASMLSELVVRHGNDAWVEPFLDEFGPWIQLQLSDLADFLEVSENYYNWRNVSSTKATCFVYACLAVVSIVPDHGYSMKIFWLSCGLFFFLSRPVGARYPRFRHVVDPVRWLYWDQPTTTEAAFGYLKAQMVSALQNADISGTIEDGQQDDVFLDCQSKPDSRDTHPCKTGADANSTQNRLLSFAGHWQNHRGRLELTRSTARFVSTSLVKTPSLTSWQRPLSDLLEVRKTDQPPKGFARARPSTRGSAALSILWAPYDEPSLRTTEEVPNEPNAEVSEVYLYGMDKDERDKAFNALIGLSERTWIELQPEASWQTRVY